jgi:hypothetical protein
MKYAPIANRTTIGKATQKVHSSVLCGGLEGNDAPDVVEDLVICPPALAQGITHDRY